MKQIFFILLIVSSCLDAQVRSRSVDVFEELETGNLTLRFYNALNGAPIEGGIAAIEKSGEYFTDDEGKVVFPPPEEDGVLQVLFTADGYVSTLFPIEIMAGTIFFNRISVSPMLDIKFLRVVVDWSKEPLDLDAHFIKTDGYHLSYRNMRVLADGTGMLDIDAMKGYGPETITVHEISNRSAYEYSVHDYSHQRQPNSKELSRSKATVKVYGNGKLLNIFQVPREKEGNVWKVFRIEQGQLREMRQLGIF
jgi:hypothetical protein